MSKFIAEIAQAVHDLTSRGLGTDFWLGTTVVSSGIVKATLQLTQVSTGGDLVVEDIILKTNGVGLTGGDTLQIVCDNVKGTLLILGEAVSRLGVNKTTDMAAMVAYQAVQDYNKTGGSAGTAKNCKTVLESGKRIGIKSDQTANTGAGTIDVFIKFRRLAADADVKLA